MKYLSLLIVFICSSFFANAQNKKIEQYKKKLLVQIDSLEKHKPLDDYNGNWIAKLEKEFYIDTFYIERLWSYSIDVNGSTMGITQAAREAEKGYDKLLNKYYNKLSNRLNVEDKKKLLTSQRNWIKFRDSEKQINYLLYKDEYSDGGTLHKIFVSHHSVDITKNRVIELYLY